MAEYVGAELIDCSTGSPIDRIQAGASRSFGDRPVILEGGAPLAEGSIIQLFDRSGPVIALGADSTYHDILWPLPDRSRVARLAHRVGQRFVDGTLAVSERIATIARQLTDQPVRVVHPFIETDRYEALGDAEPELMSDRILCVGKYRPKNGQDLLLKAIDRIKFEVHVDFVGPDTRDLPEATNVTRHGFITEERLIELFGEASLFVFPALAGAFPVATLESFRARLPVLTTTEVGTSDHARMVDPRLVVPPELDALANGIERYVNLNEDFKRTLSERAGFVGATFDERSGLDTFAHSLVDLLDDINADVTVEETANR